MPVILLIELALEPATAVFARVFVFVAVGAVLLLMLASLARAATVKSARGYSISAPDGWRVVKGAMGTDLILMAKPTNGFQPNVNVVVRQAPRGVGLLQGRTDFEKSYQRLFADFKWMGRGTTKVGGETALSNTASYSMGTPARKIFMHHVVTVHRGNVYSFTGTSLLSQRAALAPQFAAAFRTIKWTL